MITLTDNTALALAVALYAAGCLTTFAICWLLDAIDALRAKRKERQAEEQRRESVQKLLRLYSHGLRLREAARRGRCE